LHLIEKAPENHFKRKEAFAAVFPGGEPEKLPEWRPRRVCEARIGRNIAKIWPKPPPDLKPEVCRKAEGQKPRKKE